MRDRGLESPDDGDALALTFAQPLGPEIEVDRVSGDHLPMEFAVLGPDAWMA
jgi:hypothetical protein